LYKLVQCLQGFHQESIKESINDNICDTQMHILWTFKQTAEEVAKFQDMSRTGFESLAPTLSNANRLPLHQKFNNE